MTLNTQNGCRKGLNQHGRGGAKIETGSLEEASCRFDERVTVSHYSCKHQRCFEWPLLLNTHQYMCPAENAGLFDFRE